MAVWPTKSLHEIATGMLTGAIPLLRRNGRIGKRDFLERLAQRTTHAVYDPILNTVSSAECANYFASAGYERA